MEGEIGIVMRVGVAIMPYSCLTKVKCTATPMVQTGVFYTCNLLRFVKVVNPCDALV